MSDILTAMAAGMVHGLTSPHVLPFTVTVLAGWAAALAGRAHPDADAEPESWSNDRTF